MNPIFTHARAAGVAGLLMLAAVCARAGEINSVEDDGTAPISAPAALPDAQQPGTLMEEARQAMLRNQYALAIEYYSKLLQYPANRHSQEAQELLGLARERNGQLAHAKAVYEIYLQLYPEGEGAERVRQRLAGMLTAALPEKPKLREVKPAEERGEWLVHGGLSQYYRHEVLDSESGGSETGRSVLETDADVSVRKTDFDYKYSARFNAGYDYGFLSGDKHTARLRVMYFDMLDRRREWSGRIGRQTASSGGAMGRFDGLLAGVDLAPRFKLKAVTGFPVERTSQTGINTDTYFYGLSAGLGTYANAWDGNVFAIEQRSEGFLDRRAVGGELRYFKENRSFFGLVDYDISYRALNTAFLVGTWISPSRGTVSLTVDQRKGPFLHTRNALIGQTARTLDALAAAYTEDQIRDLARDRTAGVRSYIVSASHPLGERLQIYGDITLSTFSSTPASGGVEAMPGTGDEYYFNLQFMVNDIFQPGDSAMAGFQYSDTRNADTYALIFDTRHRVGEAWRINPRVRAAHRQIRLSDAEEWTITPGVRINYFWRRQVSFEAEIGGIKTTLDEPAGSEESTRYLFSLGYRWDF